MQQTVNDILVKTDKGWNSLKEQQVYVNNVWRPIASGLGVWSNGKWYTLYQPVYTMTFTLTVGRNDAWGNGYYTGNFGSVSNIVSTYPNRLDTFYIDMWSKSFAFNNGSSLLVGDVFKIKVNGIIYTFTAVSVGGWAWCSGQDGTDLYNVLAANVSQQLTIDVSIYRN